MKTLTKQQIVKFLEHFSIDDLGWIIAEAHRIYNLKHLKYTEWGK